MAERVSLVAVEGLGLQKDDAILSNRIKAVTLTQYIMDSTEGDREFALFMNGVQHACKVTANAIKKAGPCDLYGLANIVNSTGDDVKKLDVIANTVWVEALTACGACSVLVSEEEEEPIILSEPSGSLCVAFDPLDGSSNIDCNVSVGSIFSVFRRKSTGVGNVDDILRPGRECIAAGYSMYGASTELVFTYGKGVMRFALDTSIGEFLFVEQVNLPDDGGKKIYSCNEGNLHSWDPPIKDFVRSCKESGYAARYVGSMVSDVHRTLLYGGIFLYPADQKSKKGKLRVLYEGFPMAMITEQAGGVASTGMFMGKIGRVLDVVPANIHDKCPIIMGGSRDVEKVLGLYA
mmetsp:Transcript_43332/g.114053  ORF Transcript_43332/g.114053 Transcript_43332/m.114053 type:complete len:348 (-) Transcript_43332:164-1207(-)|eukprot:CAMPEP_0194495892 /NCGR_PEP_ID=MMETSP0253-20130528/13341_1 /TAXON_ID=2966 /ORGANISM="Noctiluca scintillans" /LENGTH=347 /DNA_ID=CAMNT_0039337217 /DNA_START=58 /DNA_END=1101 /DNA_ORIENTATION=-